MSSQTEAWIASLQRDFPESGPPDPNQFDGRGDLRPVIPMKRLSQWLMSEFERGDFPTVDAFLARLEDDYPGLERQSRKLLENAIIGPLPWPGEPGAGVAEHLGPRLAEAYERFHHGGVGIVEWIAELVDAFPPLEPLYRDHLSAFSELLPALFLGDVVRWLEHELVLDGSGGRALLARVEDDYPRLDSLAQVYVRDAIVWALPIGTEPGSHAIRSWLGPTLRELYGDAH